MNDIIINGKLYHFRCRIRGRNVSSLRIKSAIGRKDVKEGDDFVLHVPIEWVKHDISCCVEDYELYDMNRIIYELRQLSRMTVPYLHTLVAIEQSRVNNKMCMHCANKIIKWEWQVIKDVVTDGDYIVIKGLGNQINS